jgi:hypothetical protein
MDTINFLFPQQNDLENIKKFLEKAGNAGPFMPQEIRRDDIWEAEMHISSGAIFEKATVARIDLCGGRVEGILTDIRLLQAFAWPENPCLPGMIIMASASSTEGADPIITFYTDLIMQNDALPQADKVAFTAALSDACRSHGQDIAEYQSLLGGRGMLGACAAECGMLYFFEQSDAAMLKDMLLAPLKAYADILSGAPPEPSAKDFQAIKRNRAKIINWMLTQDYGVKVSVQNNIPMDVIETYGFPPRVSN